MATIDVELLSREGCHLCEDVLAELDRLAAVAPLTVRVVDIDADPALRHRYSLRIPVVRVDGRVRCEGRITQAQLRAALGAVTA